MSGKKILLGSVLLLMTAVAPLLAHADMGDQFDQRVDTLSVRIDQALNHGDITPPQAAKLHQQVRSIRTDAHAALYDLGTLDGPVGKKINDRINAVSQNLVVYSGHYIYYPGASARR